MADPSDDTLAPPPAAEAPPPDEAERSDSESDSGDDDSGVGEGRDSSFGRQGKLSFSTSAPAAVLSKAASDAMQHDIGKHPLTRRNSRRWAIEAPPMMAASSRSALPGGPPSVAETILETAEEEEEAEADTMVPLEPAAEAHLVDDRPLTSGTDAVLAEINNDPLLEVLKKVPAQRTDEDLAFISAQTSQVKFFRQLEDPKLHIELCRHITWDLCPKDQAIFKQGDEGTTFYIIYTGAVKVLIQDKGGPRIGSGDFGSLVCVLEDGDSFGELALLGNGVRAATIVTAMPTQLLRVEKEAYDRSLHRVHEHEVGERMRFLARMFLFSEWTDDELTRLCKVLTRQRYAKNATVIQQGTNTDHMYFVVSGRLRVLKVMDLSSSLTDKLTSTRGGRGVRRLIEGDDAPPTSGLGSPGTGAMPSSPRSSHGGSFRASPRGGLGGRGGDNTGLGGSGGGNPAPVLELGEMSTQMYFGELALLAGRDKGRHTASVVTTTPVELLLLNKYDFYHCIGARTQQIMRNYAAKFYLDDTSIRSQIKEQHRWETYKKDLLKDVLRARGGGMQGGLSPRGR